MDHMRALWSVLSDNGATLEKVSQALTGANRHLMDGLTGYQHPLIMELPTLSFDTTSFVEHFRSVTNLDEVQVSRLLTLFFAQEYCGSLQDFTSIVQQIEHREGLSRNLQCFHLDERMDLLRSIEHLIVASQNTSHPHTDIAQQFMADYNVEHKMKDSLIQQLAHLDVDAPLPSQSPTWHAGNLQERIIILRCLFRYDEAHMQAQDFVDLLTSVNLQDKVPNVAELKDLYSSVLHAHSVLLVKSMQIASSERFEELLPFSDLIEERLLELSSIEEYSPVLLAWTLLTGTYGEGTPTVRALGNSAMQQSALNVAKRISSNFHLQMMSDVIYKLMADLFQRILIQNDQKNLTEFPKDFRTEAVDFVRRQPVSVPVSSSSDSSIPLALSKDPAIFVQPNLDIKVHHELAVTYRTADKYRELEACGALQALSRELSATAAVSALKKVRRSKMPNRLYRHFLICDTIKEYRAKMARFATVPEELDSIIERTRYGSNKTRFMRSYGPPPNWEDPLPTISSEILIRHIPPHALENMLIPLLEQFGRIYEVRLMMDDLSTQNRGFAFVRFCTKQAARDAVQKLHGYEFLSEKFLQAEMNTSNTRLIVRGLKPSDSKAFIKGELTEAGVVDDVDYETYFDKNEKTIDGKKALNCGSCYLVFDTNGEAAAALDLIGSKSHIFTRNLSVGWADPPFKPDLSRATKLVVSKIYPKVTNDRLDSFFEEFGASNVERNPKAEYAFIPFKDHDDAAFALQHLQGRHDGIFLEMNLADPEQDHVQNKKRLVDEADRMSRENRAESMSVTSKFSKLMFPAPSSPSKRIKH